MAKMAIERKTGARGLRAILETVLMDVMYQVPDEAADDAAERGDGTREKRARVG